MKHKKSQSRRVDKVTGFCLKVFVTLMFGGLILTVVLPSKTERAYTSYMPSSQSNSNPEKFKKTLTERKEKLFETIRRFSQGLALVTKGNKEGEALSDLFEKSHIPVMVHEGITYVSSPHEITQTHFLVKKGVPSLRQRGVELIASFNTTNRTLTINDQPTTDCWCGFVAGHEMKHVHDIVMDIEVPSPLWSDEYLAGEVRAYEFEITLIEQWTHGEFKRRVAQSMSQLAHKHVNQWTKEDIKPFEDLFPPAMSQMESDTRVGLYAVAIAFQKVEQSGANDVLKEKMRLYRALF